MLTTPKTHDDLLRENERLRLRLEEADAVVEAIRSGIVDAVVANSNLGESVYTLEGADRPYRLLVQAMQHGVAVLNADGVVLYCNPCLAVLFKVSVEKVTGCTVDDFVADGDRALLVDMLWKVEKGSTQKEVQLRRQDGTTFPAMLTVSELPLRKFCLLVTDLSQQRLYDDLVVSKAALVDSEIRYRRLFETAKDGVLILDMESGRITDANPFMSELLGYVHEHFLGKELWEIGLFADKSANEAAVRKLQETGYIRYEHLPLETSSGLRVEVEVVANAYREDHHRVIQCNIRDITDRSRLEKLMQQQAATLADLDRRKDEFLAMLGHELRNPLAPITNAVQLLRLQRDKGKLQNEACAIIERQVGQLTRLVEDMLEVSRITTGKIRLQQERIVLNGIMERAVETTRPLIDQRGHALTVSLSPHTIWLYADAARLEQVVVNLLTNAAKYTHDGGRITLAVQQEGQEAVLRVRDTGVGIAPELLPHIFDLFTQAERSLDRSQGGLGIGLCLVQRLVEMHAGTVEVNSALGKGSEFVVRLPIWKEQDGELKVEPNRRDSLLLHPPSASKVLIVDDNADAAQSLGLLLEASGHEVRTAFEGGTVLQIAIDFRPNVIFLDLGLPGIDGFEVAKRLRKRPDLKNIVLVALTGYGQVSDMERSRNAGFDHHLVKPADLGKVLKILATNQESGVRNQGSEGRGQKPHPDT